MSIILVIIALGIAIFAASVRVKSADDTYKKAVLASELAEKIEKNYLQNLDSVYKVCADFFRCDISNGDALGLEIILSEHLGEENTEFSKQLLLLCTARGSEIENITVNLKDLARKSKEKAVSHLNAVKPDAYIFYVGIVLILAFLIL